jgi:signal transduction histidine kinase
MIVVFCCGLIIGWLSTYFFVKTIIKPLEKLKSNLTNINYNNLGIRLLEKGQGEEVDSLSATFNQLLASLQQAFSFQKDFVHYASHELRTPLAAMVSLTENSMSKPLSVEELQETFKELYQQQKNLADITNSLLVLSDNKNNFNNLDYPAIRLDEMVFRSVEIIKNIYPDAQIEVNLEGELSNENSLLISANEPLILMAFNNLLKNALQYATDSKVILIVNSTQNGKEVRFLNAGKPFDDNEKEKLFTPFFRGSNATAVKGHGLGLPLVRQIIQQHKASITYIHNDGFNEFKIIFPGSGEH